MKRIDFINASLDEKVKWLKDKESEEPKKHFIYANERVDSIFDIIDNGFPKGYDPCITEIRHLLRYHLGNLMVVTGYSFHGKSHFIEQVLCGLMCQHKLKVGYYAAESQTFLTFQRAIEIINANKIQHLNKEIVKATSDFLNDKMYVINSDNGLLTQEKLYEHINVAFAIENVDFFLIDNASTIEDLATDDKQQIRKFLNELKLITKKHKKTIIVVAHPTKPMGPTQLIDGYKISGAAEWFNLVDVGLTVFRDFQKQVTTISNWKTKNYWEGVIGDFDINFNNDTRRFGLDQSPMLKFAPAKHQIPMVSIDTSDFEDYTPF